MLLYFIIVVVAVVISVDVVIVCLAEADHAFLWQWTVCASACRYGVNGHVSWSAGKLLLKRTKSYSYWPFTGIIKINLRIIQTYESHGHKIDWRAKGTFQTSERKPCGSGFERLWIDYYQMQSVSAGRHKMHSNALCFTSHNSAGGQDGSVVGASSHVSSPARDSRWAGEILYFC